MKQASNSLLTLCPIPFKAKACISALLRDEVQIADRLFTPFHVCREGFLKKSIFSVLLDSSCPPRSFIRSRLGEGRIRSLLIAVCFISIAFSMHPGLAAGDIVINLKEQASVLSDTIVLKDLADLQGTDSAAVEKLGQTPLGPAPAFGFTSTLSRHQIIDAFQKAAGVVPGARFSGATVVEIKLKGKPVEFEEIERLLKNHLSRTTSWKESEIEIQSIEKLEGLELPPGEAQIQVSSRSPLVGRGKIIFPLEVVKKGQVLRMIWIAANIRIHAEIVTAAKSIRPGVAITSDDIIQAVAYIYETNASCFRSLDEILGKISKRNFSPGDPLTREAFFNAFLIKHGETVQLRLERNGLVLTALGRAEQDGRLGQIIKVRSLEFSTLLSAQVTGKAEARIQ
jgi:flagellar basal body P-ring formation protein FlgA